MLTYEEVKKLHDECESAVPTELFECIDLMNEYSYRIYDDLEQLFHAQCENDIEEMRKRIAAVTVYMEKHMYMLNLGIEGVCRFDRADRLVVLKEEPTVVV